MTSYGTAPSDDNDNRAVPNSRRTTLQPGLPTHAAPTVLSERQICAPLLVARAGRKMPRSITPLLRSLQLVGTLIVSAEPSPAPKSNTTTSPTCRRRTERRGSSRPAVAPCLRSVRAPTSTCKARWVRVERSRHGQTFLLGVRIRMYLSRRIGEDVQVSGDTRKSSGVRRASKRVGPERSRTCTTDRRGREGRHPPRRRRPVPGGPRRCRGPSRVRRSEMRSRR